jgi:hypothetical protein
MDRFVVVARLKSGGRERAEELLAEGDSSEDLEAPFEHGAIFLSESEVIFLLEGKGAAVICSRDAQRPGDIDRAHAVASTL